jgi:dUTP pyrophosphatase
MSEKINAVRGVIDAVWGTLHAIHQNFPHPDTPFEVSAAEEEAYVKHITSFFTDFGFNVVYSAETGPDAGHGKFVLMDTTFDVHEEGDSTPFYKFSFPLGMVRAFITHRQTMLTEETLAKLPPPVAYDRNCIQVEVKVLDEELYWGKEFAPRGSEDAAGVDLMAAVTEDTFLEPGETKLIPTGLAFFLKNPNYVGLIHPRSGLGHKHGIVLGNLTGVIDADYNGQLMVSLWNRNTQGAAFKISRGDRIAQYLIQPVVMGLFKQVNEFSTETERGAGGFGSSGAGQEVMRGTMVTDGKSVHVHSEQPLVTTLVDKEKTFGERMNEARPRIFKKEGVFTKEEMAANMDIIMANLQVAIDLHNGMDFVAEELREDQLEAVIKWALEFIDGSGGDSTLVKITVERFQDWNHEVGQLFNRRANMNLFYTDTKFVRITHPACTFILKNYVIQ